MKTGVTRYSESIGSIRYFQEIQEKRKKNVENYVQEDFKKEQLIIDEGSRAQNSGKSVTRCAESIGFFFRFFFCFCFAAYRLTVFSPQANTKHYM